MDYGKLDSRDIELKAGSSSRDNAQVKKAGFEHRMDRVQEYIKKADTPEKVKRGQDLKRATLHIYNKYSGTNHKT